MTYIPTPKYLFRNQCLFQVVMEKIQVALIALAAVDIVFLLANTVLFATYSIMGLNTGNNIQPSRAKIRKYDDEPSL